MYTFEAFAVLQTFFHHCTSDRSSYEGCANGPPEGDCRTDADCRTGADCFVDFYKSQGNAYQQSEKLTEIIFLSYISVVPNISSTMCARYRDWIP